MRVDGRATTRQPAPPTPLVFRRTSALTHTHPFSRIRLIQLPLSSGSHIRGVLRRSLLLLLLLLRSSSSRSLLLRLLLDGAKQLMRNELDGGAHVVPHRAVYCRREEAVELEALDVLGAREGGLVAARRELA